LGAEKKLVKPKDFGKRNKTKKTRHVKKATQLSRNEQKWADATKGMNPKGLQTNERTQEEETVPIRNPAHAAKNVGLLLVLVVLLVFFLFTPTTPKVPPAMVRETFCELPIGQPPTGCRLITASNAERCK